MSLKRLFPKFDAFCHRLNCSFNRTQIKHKSLDRFGTWKVHNVPLTHCLHITSQADCTITCYFITFAFNFRDNSLYFSVILAALLDCIDCIYLYHKTWSSYIPHHDISSGVRASRLHRLLEYQEHNLNDNNLCQIWIWSNFDIWCVKIHTFKVMYVLLFYIMTILFVQHISVSIWKMFRSNAQRKLLSNFIPEWKRPVLTLFIGWFGDMTSWNDKTTRKWMVSLQIITIKSIDNNDCWFVTLDPSLSRTRKHPPSMRMKICEYSICKL